MFTGKMLEIANLVAFANKFGNRYLKRHIDNRASYMFNAINKFNESNDSNTERYSDYQMSLYYSVCRQLDTLESKCVKFGFSYDGLSVYHDGRIESNGLKNLNYIDAEDEYIFY